MKDSIKETFIALYAIMLIAACGLIFKITSWVK